MFLVHASDYSMKLKEESHIANPSQFCVCFRSQSFSITITFKGAYRMISSFIKCKMLTNALLIATLGLPQLSAMDQPLMEEEIEQQRGQALYDQACAFVATESTDQVKAHFNGPLCLHDGESVYKNALRFAYAQHHGQDIDDVKCVAFLRDCNKYWINTENATALSLGSYAHELLTEKYLKHVIPLLQPVLKEPVKSLHLASTFLRSLPKNLQLLGESGN